MISYLGFWLDIFSNFSSCHFSCSLIWIFNTCFSKDDPSVSLSEDFWVWNNEKKSFIFTKNNTIDSFDWGEAELHHGFLCLALSTWLFAFSFSFWLGGFDFWGCRDGWCSSLDYIMLFNYYVIVPGSSTTSSTTGSSTSSLSLHSEVGLDLATAA